MTNYLNTHRLESVACIYCSRDQRAWVPVDTPEMDDYSDFMASVPTVDDDEMWEAIAYTHETDCEWVTTRAHRI